MQTIAPLVLGVRSAWRTPDAITKSLTTLLELPSTGRGALAGSDARLAVRAAHAAIARLARLRPAHWRNSCLFRSVAECLVLRAYGLPARVVLGVGTTGEHADVIAHAWVECNGVDCVSTRGLAELETLSPRSPRSHAERAARE
jgi:hypothetical protein